MRLADPVRRAAERLSTGSSILARRAALRFAARCRKARRDDLSGVKAALGPLLLLGVAVGALYVMAGIVRARPWLMWPLVGTWCLAAWRTGKPAADAAETTPDNAPEDAPETTSEGPPETSPEDVYGATLAWVWQMIGDRQGVHLRDLLTNARSAGLFEDLDVAAFRALLEGWGIPVRPSVRVRGVGVSVGIHRDDLPPLSEPLPEPSPQESTDPRLHAS